MKNILKSVFSGRSLTRDEAYHAMELILSGQSSPEQLSGFLGSLRTRGETTQELVGFAEAILSKTERLPAECTCAIDTCGTGGDESGTFNISTAAALVLAGGGVKVAKHGNRSVSSQSGSADVLEALGLTVEQSAHSFSNSLAKAGFGFLFAPFYHPVLSSVSAVRRALGVRTAFNLLGPMLNPARVRRQVVGVFDRCLAPTLAESLKMLGSEEAMVVSGDCGMDEFTLTGSTQVVHLKAGEIRTYLVSPEEFGLRQAPRSDLIGGSARENATVIESVLSGKMRGAKRDVVLLNAAAGFVVAGHAPDLREGIRLAARAIDCGDAHRTLKSLRVLNTLGSSA